MRGGRAENRRVDLFVVYRADNEQGGSPAARSLAGVDAMGERGAAAPPECDGAAQSVGAVGYRWWGTTTLTALFDTAPPLSLQVTVMA